MKLFAENIDFYPDTLIDIIDILLDLTNKEERSFEEIKRIKNIVDDLDSFNMTVTLQDIDMLKYTLLLSFDNITVDLVEDDDMRFKEIEFENSKNVEKYNRLITQYKAFEEILGLEDKLMQYIQPNSRLVNARVSMSVKDFVYFALLCSKYDELLDINVLLSNFDDLLEKLVTVSLALYNLYFVDDLFIRVGLDEENRKSLLDSGTINACIVSNEEYIQHCIDTFKASVKLSVIGSCSLVAYREIVDYLPKQQIKIENISGMIQQEYISLTFPREFSEIDPNVANALDGYVYEWYQFIDELKKDDEEKNNILLCCLGCFSSVFKMNTAIENYFKLITETNMSEVFDLMNVVVNKLTN
jgi:hypothetical protein